MHRLIPLSLTLVLGALGALLGASPAHAEGQFCTGRGVSVVVDYQSLGGGSEQKCDEDGAGKTAAQVFAESGFDLTPVGAFPGAACQVDGKPEGASCAQMPPANAYWGLYLAKGSTWDYAPKGADELTLADGDFVGFSWQSSKTSTPPGAAPGKATATPSASPQPQQAQQQEQEQDGGLPWWVPAVVVVVLVGAGVTLVARRRGAGDGPA